MSALTGRSDVMTRLAKGYAQFLPYLASGHTATLTAGAAASGFHSIQLFFNSIGTTQPGTLVQVPLPPALTGPIRSVFSMSTISSARAVWMANLYVIGTVDLTVAAGGEMFTHDAATFPMLRTVQGAANTAIDLIPIIYVTTATTTTAPAFIIRNPTGPASGYTDQDGNATTGTKTFTFPAAATAVCSAFVLRLETGDNAIRDISNIESVTAAAAGAATIFGMEILYPLGIPTNCIYDGLFGGLLLSDHKPATATSGTATSYCIPVGIGVAASIGIGSVRSGVIDT